jgi:hypothetical protein
MILHCPSVARCHPTFDDGPPRAKRHSFLFSESDRATDGCSAGIPVPMPASALPDDAGGRMPSHSERSPVRAKRHSFLVWTGALELIVIAAAKLNSPKIVGEMPNAEKRGQQLPVPVHLAVTIDPKLLGYGTLKSRACQSKGEYSRGLCDNKIALHDDRTATIAH